MKKLKKIFIALLAVVTISMFAATSAFAASQIYSTNVGNIFSYEVIGTAYLDTYHIVSGIATIVPTETNHTFYCYVDIVLYDNDSGVNFVAHDDDSLVASAVYVPGSDVSNIARVAVESEYDCDNGTYTPNLPTILTFYSGDF